MGFVNFDWKKRQEARKKLELIRRREYLSDNWIDIKEVDGRYMVTDTRYNIDQPIFDTLEEAVDYGEKQIGVY